MYTLYFIYTRTLLVYAVNYFVNTKLSHLQNALS